MAFSSFVNLFHRHSILVAQLAVSLSALTYMVLSLERQLGRSHPVLYYTEMALALKSEYEAIETHKQERWLSNKIIAFRAIQDVSLLVLYEVTSY